MLTHITKLELGLDYSKLDHLGWWSGAKRLGGNPPLRLRARPMFRAYVQIIRTADWDRAQIIRIRRTRHSI